jgi:long-chain acyl-CoA synthetase
MVLAEALDQVTAHPRVGLMLPTSGAFPAALLGAWLARRTTVPLNYLLGPPEMAHIVADSGLDTVVTSRQMLAHLDAELLPEHVRVLAMEELDFSSPLPLRWPPWPDPDEAAVVLYTSGTSGLPKGVVLTHRNLQTNVEDCVVHARLRGADTFLGVLPQFHSFGLTALTLIPLRLGACVVYQARFHPRGLVRSFRSDQPDVFMAVPSMYAAMLSVKGAGPEDFASLRCAVSGGEALPAAVERSFRERFGVQILQGYGLTETGPVLNWATPDRFRPGSVGPPLPRVSEIIVDEHDQPVPPGRDGEILAAGPSITPGYLGRPELNAEAFVQLPDPAHGRRKCWFRTGDMGRQDEDGYLYVTGRKKEMLIVGGENVYPGEIEETLADHPSVADAGVVGEADEMRGEQPVAYVELVEGAEHDAHALRAHCREQLASYKVPRRIEALPQLPRGPTGKVLRRALKG